jgi:metallo-beta-lactamase class B
MRFLILPLLFLSYTVFGRIDTIQISKNVKLLKVGENTYIHQSYLETENYGKVSCNGLLYIQENEAIIADTPASTIASKELHQWLVDSKISLKAIFPTHFHDDCIAGIDNLISPSTELYLFDKTDSLMRHYHIEKPSTIYSSDFTFTLNQSKVEILYRGNGHTKDNVVVWLPSEKILFGGCLIKSLNATKGYLGDADLDNWRNTVGKVKASVDEKAKVIPGHGNYGGIELLEYTIQLFSKQ